MVCNCNWKKNKNLNCIILQLDKKKTHVHLMSWLNTQKENSIHQVNDASATKKNHTSGRGRRGIYYYTNNNPIYISIYHNEIELDISLWMPIAKNQTIKNISYNKIKIHTKSSTCSNTLCFGSGISKKLNLKVYIKQNVLFKHWHIYSTAKKVWWYERKQIL